MIVQIGGSEVWIQEADMTHLQEDVQLVDVVAEGGGGHDETVHTVGCGGPLADWRH